MESNLQGLRAQNLDRDVQDSDRKQQRRRNQKSRPLGRYNLKSRNDMTPQEKAKELVNKMFNCDKSTPDESMAMLYPHAKQCALIAVDEIMKAPHENNYIELIPSDADDTDWFWNKFDDYWNEVKTEIEKL